jgi:MerR family copper efflux transcriptional regulator
MSIEDKPLTTSRLCKIADVTRGQLRVYEREGLLLPPSRMESGYRNYSPDTVARLKAIRQLKEIGFTLFEIAALLNDRDDGELDHELLQAKAAELVQTIDARIERLKVVRGFVSAVAAGDMGALGDPDCSFLVKFLSVRNENLG